MVVNCDIRDRNLIVSIKGELDHHNADYLRNKIDMNISNQNAKNIIFNFSGIDFMDSSGIGLIMGRYKRINSTGGNVALANISSRLDRIFSISGIYKIMDKYSEVEEAIKAL